GSAFIRLPLVGWGPKIQPGEIRVAGFLLAPIVCFFVPQAILPHIINVPRLAANASVLLESALPWWGVSDGATAHVTAPLHAIFEALHHSRWALPVSAAFTSIVGAGAGGGLVWTIGWLGEKAFGKEAMGFGDVKLMAMIGGFLGWQGVLSSMILACVVGSIYGIGHKVKTGRTKVT